MPRTSTEKSNPATCSKPREKRRQRTTKLCPPSPSQVVNNELDNESNPATCSKPREKRRQRTTKLCPPSPSQVVNIELDNESNPATCSKPREKRRQRTTKLCPPSPSQVVNIELDNESNPATCSKPREKRRRKTSKLCPPSPSQVVYVQKHQLDNEVAKLNGMQADLHKIGSRLANMDVSTAGGSKPSLLTALEEAARVQSDLVGNMLVVPSPPTPAAVAGDGFDQGLSWDDLQQASIAVQPRMFGQHALSTHLAERNLILESLHDLHIDLDSRPSEEEQAANPAAMKTCLMPHQKHALAWLRWREALKPVGGILADDMGLGKTIMIISLIAGDRENGDSDDDDEEPNNDYGDRRPRAQLIKGGTLVVCPASLLTQWEDEVKKHCLPGRITTFLHHGDSRATQPERLAHTDIVLTTYNLLQRDHENKGVLARIRWRRVILDEAHTVRNYNSDTSRAVCMLRARRRWAVTGTPVHNKSLDLFALLKFLQCTPFDSLSIWKKWIGNNSPGGQERLSTIMRCIMLRRTKAQLQAKGQLEALPSRTAHVCLVTLTKAEMNVYQKVLVSSQTMFAQFLNQQAAKEANKDSAYKKMKQGANLIQFYEILVLLGRLRQVCCHCGIIADMLDVNDGHPAKDEGGKDLPAEFMKLSLDDSKSGSDEGPPGTAAACVRAQMPRSSRSTRSCRARNRDGKRNEPAPEPEHRSGRSHRLPPVTTAAEAIRSVLTPNNPVFRLTHRSSKIKVVMDVLRKNVLAKGEKAVIVSQWTSVLSLVEAELNKERVTSVTLSARVPVSARAALVNALNDATSDVRIMLLSLCAGSVGLSLCGASHLLLLDPHWNPQLEEKVQDRIYCVGQTRPVHVYRVVPLLSKLQLDHGNHEELRELLKYTVWKNKSGPGRTLP